MARSVISNKKPINTVRIEEDDYFIPTIRYGFRSVRINEVLPFRVKFTSIGIEGISGNNVPPIPLQIIGYSNYIL